MSGRFELVLPDLGEGITEAVVGAWLVAPGALVAEDQPLVEVETDKAAVEIPSPVSGRLIDAVARSGATVPVGSVLAVIEVEVGKDAVVSSPERGGHQGASSTVDPDGDGPSGQGPVGNPSKRLAGDVVATPGARRRAVELGVDIAELALGAGVVREDQVIAFAEGKGNPALQAGAMGALTNSLPPERQVIAARLTRAAAVPTVTNVDQVDFEAVLSAGAPPLAVLAYVVARTLPEHPVLNLASDAGADPSRGVVHLGIATQAAAGLVVPVIRGAELASLTELSAAIADVTSRVRSGHLRPDELSGSTFTITSAGRLSGLWSTPLLNLPERAILGLYRIEERPVVRRGAIEIRRAANLSITFDHRYLDGMEAASFLAAVKERLEQWQSGVGSEGRFEGSSSG
ncbi:MAG: dihydrolipoamide acetyltransferase family protein [Acidimicrobiales bacterium]